ncbi:hypothetical protein NSE01_30140 [Novosphingobium sediminis]|uniref:DUF1109 domain-containing protein n=1 Tax=Novosphingobium sediminis TaxID=707214 RepID=A0A512AN92_9SPHN|nr:DUF1109 domain-containing protein [Novosphingobium sediminis]GEO01182.1 hypothetical protein NSE01_30140 [Novosphingobium sediminis]
MDRKSARFASTTADELINRLVNDLEPVKPLRLAVGLCLVFGALLASATGVGLMLGLRPDIPAGRLAPHLVLESGLFLLLGLSAAANVVRMSRPHVGSDYGGSNWAMAMTALLPVSALVMGLGRGAIGLSPMDMRSGINCLGSGVLWGSLTLTALIMWLRRGAPVRPHYAALLSGVAAGSLGMFAYSLHCPSNDVVHIGLWHSGAVALSALIARLVVPPLIRW